MRLIRSALLKHPLLALAIGLSAMVLRLAVPAGFMPAIEQGRLTLALCSGYGQAVSAPSHEMASSTTGVAHHGEDRPKADNSCAFADLALPAIGSADPVLLEAALIFILASGLYPVAALPSRAALRLRPPLRGPPLPS